jgi:hypothetical protein
VYVPEWFRDVAVSKAENLDFYLNGAAAFFAQQPSGGGDQAPA